MLDWTPFSIGINYIVWPIFQANLPPKPPGYRNAWTLWKGHGSVVENTQPMVDSFHVMERVFFFFRRISDSSSLVTSYVCCQRQCAGTLPPWKQMSRIWWLLWQSFSAFGSTSVWACCLTIILSLPTQFIDLTGISWNGIFFRHRVCFWVVDFQCGALQCRVQIRDNVGAKLWAIIPNLMIYKRLRLHWDFLGIPELKLLLWL